MNLVETNWRRAWPLWGEYLVLKEQMLICTQTSFTIATIRKLQMLPIAPASFWTLVGTKATITVTPQKECFWEKHHRECRSKASLLQQSWLCVYRVSNSLIHFGNSFQLLRLASMSLTVEWTTLLQSWWAFQEDPWTWVKGSCTKSHQMPGSVEDLQWKVCYVKLVQNCP